MRANGFILALLFAFAGGACNKRPAASGKINATSTNHASRLPEFTESQSTSGTPIQSKTNEDGLISPKPPHGLLREHYFSSDLWVGPGTESGDQIKLTLEQEAERWIHHQLPKKVEWS